MKPIEQFEHNDYRIKIHQDTDAEPPSQDDEVFMVTTKNRYFVLGKEGFSLDDIRDGEHKEKYHVFPVYAYIHSGVALSLGRGGQFSDPWDSGQIGYCLVSKESFGTEPQVISWGTIPTAYDAAKGYLEAWNQYLSGQVYGYEVEDEDGNDVDSCWGFYGYDYAVKEAKEAAESARSRETREAAKIEAMQHL